MAVKSLILNDRGEGLAETAKVGSPWYATAREWANQAVQRRGRAASVSSQSASEGATGDLLKPASSSLKDLEPVKRSLTFQEQGLEAVAEEGAEEPGCLGLNRWAGLRSKASQALTKFGTRAWGGRSAALEVRSRPPERGCLSGLGARVSTQAPKLTAAVEKLSPEKAETSKAETAPVESRNPEVVILPSTELSHLAALEILSGLKTKDEALLFGFTFDREDVADAFNKARLWGCRVLLIKQGSTKVACWNCGQLQLRLRLLLSTAKVPGEWRLVC